MSEYQLRGQMLWADGEIRGGAIQVKNDKIESVSETPAANVRTIEIPLHGIISPGLIELQINGAFGHDFTADPESAFKVAASLPKYGVTSFLPTLITSPLEEIARAVNLIGRGLSSGKKAGAANIVGIHCEGPFINPLKGGAHNKNYMRNPLMQDLDIFDPALVRIVTLAPELPGGFEFIRGLQERGIIAAIGHTNATFEETLQAADAGATWATHLFNAMRTIDHRQPGVVTALLTDERLKFGIIADGVHVHPGILQLVLAAKKPAGITLTTDAIAASGMPPGEYVLGDAKIFVDEQTSRRENGALAGSIVTMEQSVKNMVTLAGCKLNDVLQMASTVPAQVIQLEQKGKLRAGYDADITILDADLNVATTIVGGEIVYNAVK